MTTYMKMGFLYGLLILVPVVVCFSVSIFWGLILIALLGGMFWNMPVPLDVDSDLNATSEDIVKELPENPETGALNYVAEAPTEAP
jgi:hypothetical protein